MKMSKWLIDPIDHLIFLDARYSTGWRKLDTSIYMEPAAILCITLTVEYSQKTDANQPSSPLSYPRDCGAVHGERAAAHRVGCENSNQIVSSWSTRKVLIGSR